MKLFTVWSLAVLFNLHILNYFVSFQDVSFAFSCPCLPGFTCVSRRRPMRLKRLERKLKLPTEAMEKLGLQFDKETTEFKVGKCQLISD